MSILIEGFVPNSNISPADPVITGVDAINVGWQENATTYSLQFIGTEEEGTVGARQWGLDGVVVPGTRYRLWIQARETGSGASFNNVDLQARIGGSNGASTGGGIFWGPSAAMHLTSSYQWFSLAMPPMPMDPEEGYEMTANSVGFSIVTFGSPSVLATKKVEILKDGGIIVEELAGT